MEAILLPKVPSLDDPKLSHSRSPSASADHPLPPASTSNTNLGDPHSHTSPPPSNQPSISSKPHSTVKPKSKANAAPRSPSPPPPPPPPTLTTVRLQIQLQGPENYQVDIAALARETGQRPPTPVQKRADTSESEEEPEPPAAAAPGEEEKKPKKKKKNAATEYYDVSDPFIDDSELALDERTYFAQTKQQGFYVSSGEVALMKDTTSKSPTKKPKSRRPPLQINPNNHDPSSSAQGPHEGTKDSPIALMSDSENEPNHLTGKSKVNTPSHPPPFTGPTLGQALAGGAMGPSAGVLRRLSLHEPPVPYPGQSSADYDSDGGSGHDHVNGEGGEHPKTGEKRKRYNTVVEGGKKRKIVDVTSFHPELQKSFEVLKGAIAAENWEQKGKFPAGIKPLLAQIAIQAIKLDEYDEHFFNLMPVLFPYNKFTMSKLIKRTVFTEHTQLLVQRQEVLLKELKRHADEGFTKAEEEWEKSCAAWDKRQKKAKAEARAHAAHTANNGDESASNAPTRHPSAEDMDVDMDGGAGGPDANGAGDGGKEGGAGGKDSQPPGKKFRLTETMKAMVWELVLLSNECCRLENEKNNLEGSVMQVSEQGLRKVLYQKMLACFPTGWMSTGQISRDVSAMKKKLEKEQAENAEEAT
ncbi:hypothetical protein V5O48_000345 [Marasmius crinis-equi]|uniref:Ubinuclein middle domain-containing protein n=1 Tax=Marasmius crinis-equi TaxID=585013 RepID=A0ABR3G1B7_9AGAR